MLIVFAFITVLAAQHVHPAAATDQAGATSALTAEAVQQLLAGEGMGLAKPAEMNSYPGPKHVLDLKQPLALTAEQADKVEAIRQQMLARAKTLGREIVEAERALDAAFRGGTISDEDLAQHTATIARLQGNLRLAHLQAHLDTKRLLQAEQVRKYYELRAHQH